MKNLIAIALGGSVGALARFIIANGVYSWLGRGFPHGTLVVNVSGCLFMGLLTELMLQRFAMVAEYRAGVLIGFFGAYTTFSTFALETIYLLEQGNLLKATLNIILNNVICLAAVWFGLVAGRAFLSNDLYPWCGHGLPYQDLVFSLVGLFIFSTLAVFLLQDFGVKSSLRAVILIVFLGILTISSTLWMTLRLTEIRPESYGLSSLFAINALFGALVVWLGSATGNWLWQMNLSR